MQIKHLAYEPITNTHNNRYFPFAIETFFYLHIFRCFFLKEVMTTFQYAKKKYIKNEIVSTFNRLFQF